MICEKQGRDVSLNVPTEFCHINPIFAWVWRPNPYDKMLYQKAIAHHKY